MKYITITTYGLTEFWSSRENAINYYMNCALNCEGAERDTYMDIIRQLKDGAEIAEDWEGHSEQNIENDRVAVFGNGTNICDFGLGNDGSDEFIRDDEEGLVYPMKDYLEIYGFNGKPLAR